MFFHRVRRTTGRTWFAIVGVGAVIVAGLGAQAFAGTGSTTFSVPETGTYAGKQLPTTELIAKGLACNLDGNTMTCFDTQAAARQASSSVVSACAPMILYDGALNSVPSLQITQSGSTNLLGWANLASSWKTGCKLGRLDDIGNPPYIKQASTNEVLPGGMNNKADTAYRP
jgi:hypothetical protein